jgi:hypothetical protein
MKLFTRGCSEHLPYAAATGELSLRERLDLEVHATTCLDCTDALRDGAILDRALHLAFAPLAQRRAALAPGRVRLALGPAATTRRSLLRAPALIARLAEVSVAVGIALFAMTGTIEEPQAVVDAAPHSVIQDYFRSLPPRDDIDYFRWLRLQPAPSAERADPVRLPVGGRFDVEPAEIVTRTTSTPR